MKANYIIEELTRLQHKEKGLAKLSRRSAIGPITLGTPGTPRARKSMHSRELAGAPSRSRRERTDGVGDGESSVGDCAHGQTADWQYLYTELKRCLEHVSSPEDLVKCCLDCPLPDLAANLELLEFCNAKVVN